MPDLKALSTGTKIVLGAGLLLFIDTFLAWQKISFDVAGVEAGSVSANAWHGFWGVMLGLLTIALLVWVGLRLFSVNIPVDLPETTVTLALGALILAFALIKNLADDYSAWASYLGVLLAAAVAVGAWMRRSEAPVAAAVDRTPDTPAPPPAPPPPSTTEGV
ncbi:MAG: hypothetical protein ACRDN6_11680 [Gaiellaceae bacterium]